MTQGKCRPKKEAQAQIQRLYPSVDEVVTEKEKKKTQLIGLWKNSFKNLKQEKESRESNVA